MSLTNTCLGCHSNKAQFCDQCHNYLEVTPYCWDCHVDPITIGELIMDKNRRKLLKLAGLGALGLTAGKYAKVFWQMLYLQKSILIEMEQIKDGLWLLM